MGAEVAIAAVLHVYAAYPVLRVWPLMATEISLPVLAHDHAVTLSSDLDGDELGECQECDHYWVSDDTLPAATWMLTWVQGGHQHHRGVCGAGCADWALASLLSDPDPVSQIILHLPSTMTLPGPRRATSHPAQRGPRCSPILKT